MDGSTGSASSYQGGDIVKWLIINLRTCQPYVFGSIEQASQEAIRMSKECGGNPLFSCWEYNGKTCKCVGELWRAFGQEFDPFNCWKP